MFKVVETERPIESVKFVYVYRQDAVTMRVWETLEGDGLTCTAVVGAFARWLVATGYGPGLVDELIPGWRDLA